MFRHSRAGGNPSPDAKIHTALPSKPDVSVMDSRLRGNDEVFSKI
jgi:hypothetical protein